MKTFLGAAALVFIACGGSTSGGDASTDGGGSEASTSDGGKNLDGPYACGMATCQTGEYCVHPCCGGAPPACDPLPDSGMCPQGTHYTTSCIGINPGPGCQPDPCKPPPPFCSAKNACIGPTSSGRDAYCLCG